MNEHRSTSSGLASLVLAMAPCLCSGQIVFDGSLGAPGSLSGPNFQIPHTRGQLAGGNLFHSFSTFNLAAGESATFSGPASVNNILARVTGGSQSSIRGTLNSDIQGANLFLINPAGIIFGQGAQVNVSGAFRATTADYIELADGRRFNVSLDGNVALLSAAPEAFGFLSGSAHKGEIKMDTSPSAIDVTGLDAKGQDLALIGRKVELKNSMLRSAGGQISLAAAGSGAARVAIAQGVGEPNHNLGGDLILTGSLLSVSRADGGSIHLQGGDVLIDGAGSITLPGDTIAYRGIDADARLNASGGAIHIHANRDLLMRNGAVASTSSRNSRNGGLIDVKAANMTIDGAGAVTRLVTQNSASSTGSGGSISLDVAGNLLLREGGAIEANTLSSGAAGSILIKAGSLAVTGGEKNAFTGIRSVTSSAGNAGSVSVDVAGKIDLRDRAIIGSDTIGGSGNGGSVTVNAGSLFIHGAAPRGFSNEFLTGITGLVTAGATGKGAELKVTVDGKIDLIAGGLIDTSVLASEGSILAGHAGNIEVTAGDIEIDRAGSDFFTGIGSDTEFESLLPDLTPVWHAGGISVKAENIVLLNGGLISSSSGGSGNAGSVSVTADSIFASGSGKETKYVFSKASGIVALTEGAFGGDGASTGNGGEVSVTAKGTITLSGEGEIAAKSEGPGDGGSVLVDAGRIILSSGGKLSAKATAGGQAGTVTARANRIDVLQGGIIESLSLGSGNAGGIMLNADRFDLNGGSISSENSGSGRAGSVRLEGDELTLANGSIISVRAERADAGSIVLDLEDTVSFTGKSSVSATAGGTGKGGDVTIEANGSIVVNDAKIEATTLAGSSGQGGSVLLESDRVVVEDRALVAASSQGSGTGGDVGLDASSVILRRDGTLESTNGGSGSAGSVTVTAAKGMLMNHATVTVDADGGDAGDVVLNIGKNLRLIDSDITAEASADGGGIEMNAGRLLYGSNSALSASAGGAGGNLGITSPHVVFDGGAISADAIDGQGGVVNIAATTYFANGVIPTANSQNGADGSVVIDAQVAFQTSEEGNEAEFLNPDDALQPDCTKRAASTTSSFTRSGRGGVRRLPGGYLPSFRILK